MKNIYQNGFSLLETLVGIVVLAFSVAGSFEMLRLSELKQRHALVDIRVGEILREYTDYLLYLSYDLLPSDGAVISSGDLYQVYNQV
ncbi:MAG: prepilin-type N-terminal cleavage/methylation domain-containing protein, partial [Verrucomicrobia bacterium]|nr:prepilin-type N-terminal cleavage/methylation domain-containing protein [Verrucomicrobiota bacterium]